jgi:hypothetical protein
MANWTPEGLIGQFFVLTSRYAPPAPGIPPPIRWGDEATVRERLGPHCSDIRIERRVARFRSYSPETWVKHMRTNFGPTIRTFAALNPQQQESLAGEMMDLIRRHNLAKNHTVLGEGEYLQIVATVRA